MSWPEEVEKRIKNVFEKKWDADAASLCRWFLNWAYSSSPAVAESCRM